MANVEKKTSTQKISVFTGVLYNHQSRRDKTIEQKIVPVPGILSQSSQHEPVYIGKPLDANDRMAVVTEDNASESLHIGEPLDAYDLNPVQQHSKLEQESFEIGERFDAYDLNNFQGEDSMHNSIMIGEKLDADAPYTQNPKTRIAP